VTGYALPTARSDANRNGVALIILKPNRKTPKSLKILEQHRSINAAASTITVPKNIHCTSNIRGLWQLEELHEQHG